MPPLSRRCECFQLICVSCSSARTERRGQGAILRAKRSISVLAVEDTATQILRIDNGPNALATIPEDVASVSGIFPEALWSTVSSEAQLSGQIAKGCANAFFDDRVIKGPTDEIGNLFIAVDRPGQ